MIYGGVLQNKILMQKLMSSSLRGYIADTISLPEGLRIGAYLECICKGMDYSKDLGFCESA